MKYIIQHSIIYDPQQGTLRSENNDDEVVQLTRTASALLLTLLDDREVMSRDKVLESVWGSQGLVGSHNNLNQYLSILRRSFRKYGLDDIILSIPRTGIQINPDIKVELQAGENDNTDYGHHEIVKNSDINIILDNQKISSSPKNELQHSGYFRTYFRHIVPGVLLLSFSLFMLIYIAYEHQPLVNSFLSPLPVTACRVDALEQANERRKPVIAAEFTRIQKDLSLQCDPHHHFLFYYEDKIKHTGLGKTLLTQCTPRGDNPDGFCNNYFFFNWR